MARALAAAGADVRLIAPIAPGFRRPFAMHSLARADELPSAEPRLGGLRRVLDDARLASRLREVVARERIDVLHAHNYEALVASLRVKAAVGVPVVFHAHSVLSDELPLYATSRVLPSAAARRIGSWFDRVFPRLADLVVTLSPDVAGYMETCGVDRERISVVPPGLAATARPPADGRGAPRAVFTGNLDRYQNLDLLLDAWAEVERRVPAASLAIVTHERTRPVLSGRHRSLGRVEVVRARTLEDVSSQWTRATVGVSPRTSWSGFPVKNLNYMAAGLPIVAFEGSAKGVCDGHGGWVVRDGSPGALAAALCGALDDVRTSALRGRWAHEALLERHDWPMLADRLLRISVAAAGEARGTGLPSRSAAG